MDATSSHLRILETVSTKELSVSWKSDFGVDVSALFRGVETLELVEDPATGRISFHPPVLGDAAFYQALRRFPGYHPAQKAEHAAAATLARPGDRILDVGAGDAGFARHVDHATYTGLESDPAAVAAARAEGVDARNATMAAWRASTEFEPADLVTAFQVLEHVADPDAFVAEMAACAGPRGQIVIGVPDAESYVARLPDFMLNAPPHHVTWWTERALRGVVEGAGLGVEAVQRFPVEAWERRIWWMAKIAFWVRGGRTSPAFGRTLLAAKALGWFGAWPLQVWIPRGAMGSTLLIVARAT
ncbi:MAG: class I SAM-dependent methyltransferase [Pseudomonadota bacterium]